MRDYIVLDIETTGISPEFAMITEIGAVKIQQGKVIDRYSQLVNPKVEIPSNIVELTGITDEMVRYKPTIEDIIGDFIGFCEELPILGHNVIFDFSFLKTAAIKEGFSFEREALDTMILSRHFMERQPSYSLTYLIEAAGIERTSAHRAYDDALATYELYEILFAKYFNEDTKHNFIPKPLQWKPKKKSPITEKQKRFLSSLLQQHDEQISCDIDELSKSEASKEIDRILRTYGR